MFNNMLSIYMDKRYTISSIMNEYEFDVVDIMNIIIDHKVEYSTNTNGLFINLSLVDDLVIDIIYNKLLELKNIRDNQSLETGSYEGIPSNNNNNNVIIIM